MKEFLLKKLSERYMDEMTPFVNIIMDELPECILESEEILDTMSNISIDTYTITGNIEDIHNDLPDSDNLNFIILQNCIYGDFLEDLMSTKDVFNYIPRIHNVLDVEYNINELLAESLLKDIHVLQEIEDIDDNDVTKILILLTTLWILCFCDIDIVIE